MTKTLTENKWFYTENGIKNASWNIVFKSEVLAPVPSYEEIKRLEKKLEIATKALKEYADSSNWYETDDFGISAVDQFACDDYGYNIADKALKEMEGVK